MKLDISDRNKTLGGILFSMLLLYLFLLFGAHILLQVFHVTKLNATIFFITRAYYWFSLFLIWLYCVKVEKRPLLIWKDNNYQLLKYIKIVALIFLSIIIGLIIIQRLLHWMGINGESRMLRNLLIIFRAHKSLIFVTAITAGIVEESIFRGYLLPRLEILFRNPFTALLVSSLLFGLLHFGYGTIANMAGPFVIGLVLGYFYQKYRSLKTVILVHIVWDLTVIFLSLYVKPF